MKLPAAGTARSPAPRTVNPSISFHRPCFPSLQTTDGGATFKTVFGVNGTIYFNGIDCTSETHCCAVGESDDAPAAGAYVYCTFDGRTWNQTFAAPYQSRTGVLWGQSQLDCFLFCSRLTFSSHRCTCHTQATL